MKLPELKVWLGDVEVDCDYEYDRGEPERWNGLTGVGNPETPPSVYVTEVCVNGEWLPAEAFDQDQCDKWDQYVMDQLIEYESAINAEQAEAEYIAWEEAKRYAKEDWK